MNTRESTSSRISPPSLSLWAARLVGAVFVISACLKAADFVPFTVEIAYYRILPDEQLVVPVAVAIILIETAVGTALLTGLHLGGLTLGVTSAMLLGFSGLLGWGWAFREIGECGCFGTYVKLTPGVSLIKNVVLLALSVAAWPAARATRGVPLRVALTRALGHPAKAAVLMFVMGILAAALTLGYTGYHADRAASSAGLIDPERPFARFRFEYAGETFDLSRGDWFVALLSLSCTHCREAVPWINAQIQTVPESPPVVGLCLGSREELRAFREDLTPAFPTTTIPPLEFLRLVPGEPPRYALIRDGRPVIYWDYELPAPEELIDYAVRMQMDPTFAGEDTTPR